MKFETDKKRRKEMFTDKKRRKEMFTDKQRRKEMFRQCRLEKMEKYEAILEGNDLLKMIPAEK